NTPVYNFEWLGGTFDANSAHNQFENINMGGFPDGYGTLQYAVVAWSGDNYKVSGVTLANHNGVFGTGFGTYGYPTLATNGSITGIRGYNLGNDPHSGDSSKVSVGATGYHVSDVLGFGGT